MADHENLARQFFTATATGDLSLFEEICAAGFKGTQNGGPPMTIEQLAAYSKRAIERVQNFHYENIHCRPTESGFVEEHDVCCDFTDGSSLRLPVCIVGDVEDQKITAVREYADSRLARKLIEAMT